MLSSDIIFSNALAEVKLLQRSFFAEDVMTQSYVLFESRLVQSSMFSDSAERQQENEKVVVLKCSHRDCFLCVKISVNSFICDQCNNLRDYRSENMVIETVVIMFKVLFIQLLEKVNSLAQKRCTTVSVLSCHV